VIGHFGSKVTAIGYFGSKVAAIGHFGSKLTAIGHCLCLRHKLTGIINIESGNRFNLQDLTGKRSGDLLEKWAYIPNVVICIN
jgi:hypothetical protein